MTSGQDRVRRGRRLLHVRTVAATTVALLALAGCGNAGSGASVTLRPITVSSEAFTQGGLTLTQRYTCHGQGINPPLNWSAVPAGTKSIALVVDDSNAPITPYIYWLVFDISPGATDIQQGSLPTGARQALNSADTATYDAPCPVGHPHSYRFTVYALNKVLNLSNGASLQATWTAIAAATIGRGRIAVTGSP